MVWQIEENYFLPVEVRKQRLQSIHEKYGKFTICCKRDYRLSETETKLRTRDDCRKLNECAPRHFSEAPQIATNAGLLRHYVYPFVQKATRLQVWGATTFELSSTLSYHRRVQPEP